MARDDFEVVKEFLKARLREDEAAAHALKPGKNEDVAMLQARVLADVQTKWRLLDWANGPQRELKDWEDSFAGGVVIKQWMRFRQPVIDELVAAYADHPDFRPEWLPVENEQRRQRPSA